MKFKEKNIVITGGSNGLGRAIALSLAKQGANIIITYNTDVVAANKVKEEIASFGVKALAIKVNLLNESDRDRLVSESYAFLGDIDVLINNAGIIDRNSILDLKQDDIKNVFEVNAIAPFYLLQQFAKHMKLNQDQISKIQSELKDYCIINITSISRKLPTGLSSYEASKAALHQLTKSAAFELAQYNIRVNDIAPGLVPTNLNKHIWDKAPTLWKQRVSGIPLNRGGTPEEIAQAVESVIDNKWMTGTTLTVDGGRSVNWLGQDVPKVEDNYLSKAKL